MRIQHNIPALNAYRNYSSNTSSVAKNLEKLSSGYKINRAGDDAAGLAISEKMRAQITGLETAQKNAKDGISLVQTAEGALTEVHDMLNRMYDLAEQSANGTYDNEVDRANLQKEITSLSAEIDRIADSVNFNGINLLDGSLSADGTGSSNATVSGGGKVAYIEGLDVTSNAAVKDTFVIATGTSLAAASIVVAASKSALITYQGADGKTYTKSLANTGSGSVSLKDLINNDADLNKLFVASDSKTIESRIAGSSGPKILSIALDAESVSTSTVNKASTSEAGKDASLSFTAPGADTTFTIGDKTYEVVTTAGSAKKGNIEIVGADANTIATVLQQNGVTSATVNGTDIEITDLSQIAVDSKGPSVGVDRDAGTVYAQAATKNEFSLTNGLNVVGSNGIAQTLTVSIIDENGDTKDIEVSYTSAASAGTNRTNIMTALKNNSEINKYFDVDDTNHTLTAKTAGTNGAKLTGLATTDTATTVSNKFDFATRKLGEGAKKTLELESGVGAGTIVSINGKNYEFVNEGQSASEGNIAVTVGANANASAKNLADTVKNQGVAVTYDGANKLTFSNEGGSASGTNGGGLKLQIGDTAADYNQLKVSINDMHVKAMGLSSIDISVQDGGSDAMAKIKDAINYVSNTRGDLGATQNRLEHTINNLSVMQENIQDAEASIRDVDVAKEMMAYTKNNILVQSAQAMLAQANQLPQGVLQLLQ